MTRRFKLNPRRFHDLHALGFSVFPLLPGSKKPACSWKCFQYRLATPEELEEWAADRRGLNVAVVTGSISGNRIVLDLDSPEARRAIARDFGLPYTPMVCTARGWHLYLVDHDGVFRNFAGKLPGVDLRAEGGYVVGPGSVHETGHGYAWESGLSPADTPFAPVPEWLIDLAASTDVPRVVDMPAVKRSEAVNWCPPRVRSYASRALHSACVDVEIAKPGTRNNRLNAAAFALGRLVAAGALDRSEVEDSLLCSAYSNELVDDDGLCSVLSTIGSGLDAGLDNPRDLTFLFQPVRTYRRPGRRW